MKRFVAAAYSRPTAQDWPALLFVSATVLVVAVYRSWPDSRLWLPMALGAILVAVWHGAYDSVLAREVWTPRYQGRWMLPFLACYVGLTAIVVAAWFMVPVAALIAFLLYSSVHFGTEADAGSRFFQVVSAVAFGALPIAAACHWQANTVQVIFTTMLGGRAGSAESITRAAGFLLLPLTLVALAPVAINGREWIRRAVLIGSQLVLFRFCSPLIAFAVFFCMLHTPEHLVETSQGPGGAFSSKRMWFNLRQGAMPWFLSLFGVAVTAWLGRHTMGAYISLIFIALSALTVPHMAFAMYATHRKASGSLIGEGAGIR